MAAGKSPKANIEFHDVRFVIGTKIEDNFDQVRNDWFGSDNGFHIDSYKINLINKKNNELKNKTFKKDKILNKKLLFEILEDKIQTLCKKNMNLVLLLPLAL